MSSWVDIVALAKGKRSKHNAEAKEGSKRGTRTSPRWATNRSQEDSDDDQPSSDDPHELVSRFIWTQHQHFDEALAELTRGQKRSCWMWYIFPTPPFIVNGQERGSWTNMRYSLRTDEQAKAYLKFVHQGVNLRKNYYDATAAIVHHLEKGKTARQIVGIADEPKLQSSWEYFELMTRDEPDQELHDLIAKGLALIKDPPHKSKATKAKATESKWLGKSNFSASSDDEEDGSMCSEPSAINSSEASTSECLSEMNRSSSEVSTVEMADEVPLNLSKGMGEDNQLVDTGCKTPTESDISSKMSSEKEDAEI